MASEELRLLIQNKDLNAIDKYINNGRCVNGTYSDGTTPLFIAIDKCYDRKANASEEDVICCGEAVILRLIAAGADVRARKENTGVTPLIEALKQRISYKIICELLSAGSEVNAECNLTNMTPLMFAIIQNYNKKLIYNFIQSGANVNHKDKGKRTPFFYALNRTDKYEIVEMLTVAGANVNTEISWNIFLNYLDCKGHCKNGNCRNKELTDFLVSKGLDLKTRSWGHRSTLIHHVNCNYLISLCIRNGISVESRTQYGHTPLMYTLINEKHRCLDKVKRLLILFKANPNNSIKKFYNPKFNNPLLDVDPNETYTVCCTPLDCAASYVPCSISKRSKDRIKTIDLLLYHGSNILDKSPGKTPLHRAFNRLKWHSCGNLSCLFSALSPLVWHYLLYYDENNLCDYFSHINSEIRKKLEPFLANLKEELSLMKQKFINSNLTFHDFCLLKRFYESKPLNICSTDELNYNFDQIKEMFPISHYSIITRIKDNIVKNNRKRLLQSLEGIHIRLLPVENENDSQVDLNYDCKYLIGRYFNHHQLVTLFQASLEE